MNSITKSIHSQDAGLKIAPRNSGETSLNLSTEIMQFIINPIPEPDTTESVSFILYKEDFLKGIAHIITNLPLYKSSSKQSTKIDFSEGYFNELYTSLQTFFGDHSEQKYEVNILRRQDSRIYLNNLKKGNFSIRNFLIEDQSNLRFTKNPNGDNVLRLEYKDISSHKDKISEDATPSQNQVIYYGCPGSGKSHRVKEISGSVKEDFVFRTTFHPDTDYASFVGCYKPIMIDKDIRYSFAAQVFTKAYITAWNNPTESVYLIIEEINRGNCAQIFGDLFQLLDRDQTTGKSEYPVKADRDLAEYIEHELGHDHEGIKDGKLCLPSNLIIYATMNTSDQSLFPMDSAFKRRWDWVYVPIDYSEECKSGSFVITIGDDTQYRWVDFLKVVNEKIYDATNSEDKQMGNFFIKDSVDASVFVNKVMFYLWNEVCKEEYGTQRNFFRRGSEGKEFKFTELFGDKQATILTEFMKYLGVKSKKEE